LGGILFFLLSPEKGPIWAGAGSFFIGIGMGLSSTSFIVSIQTTVDWKMRGIATAMNMFMRTLGSAVGAAFLGGLLNGSINKYIKSSGLEDEVSVDSVNTLLQKSHRETLPSKVEGVLQEGLTAGLHQVYTGLLILAVISFVLIYFLPKGDKP
jgi:MFS family permease